MHVKCLDQYWNSLICDKVGLRDQKLRRRRRLRGRSRATLPEKQLLFISPSTCSVCLFVCLFCSLSLSLSLPLSLSYSLLLSSFQYPVQLRVMNLLLRRTRGVKLVLKLMKVSPVRESLSQRLSRLLCVLFSVHDLTCAGDGSGSDSLLLWAGSCQWAE